MDTRVFLPLFFPSFFISPSFLLKETKQGLFGNLCFPRLKALSAHLALVPSTWLPLVFQYGWNILEVLVHTGSMYAQPGFHLPMCRIQHLLLFNFIQLVISKYSNLSRSLQGLSTPKRIDGFSQFCIIYWKCKMRIWLQECVGKAKEYMSRQQHCVCLSVYLLSTLAHAPQYDARKEQKISSPFKWLVHSYAWNWEIGKEEFKILVIGTDVFWGACMQLFRCPLNSPLELLTAF